MSPAAQLIPELHVVEDLAVEDEHGCPVGAGHGLVTGLRQIEDRQALETQADVALEEHALVIGPAVRERTRHSVHDLPSVQRACESANGHNAAHGYLDSNWESLDQHRGTEPPKNGVRESFEHRRQTLRQARVVFGERRGPYVSFVIRLPPAFYTPPHYHPLSSA